MVKFISGNDQNTTVELIMDYVNCYVNGNDIDLDNINTYDFNKGYNDLMNFLELANQSYNVSIDKKIESEGRFSKIKKFIKRIIRKSIYWYIRDINVQQVDFNAYVVRTINQQSQMLKKLYQENMELKSKLEKCMDIITDIQLSKSDSIENNPKDDLWYLNFESTFRGEEADISERLMRYIPFFEGKNNVIDLGCGRGEFLSILAEKGISANGIDINKAMIELCLEKGLTVSYGDCIEYLETQPDESIEGIFSSQVIEHLTLVQLKKLMELSYKKISANGICIFETVNPMSLGVFCYGFYIDPTHSTPVHPAMLRFMAQQEGFKTTEINFINEFPKSYHFEITEDMSKGIERGFDKLNEQIFGAQDYYLLCKKA